MIYNSTNINKRNIYLSPQIPEHKRTTTFADEIHILGQAQKCGRIKPVKGIPTLHLLIIRSLITIQI
jgi:hypothetical protein